MTDVFADQRLSIRTDFLGAQHDADSLPGWVFKPVQFSQGPAGLVLNLSDGGLQVLTSATEPLADGRYEVVLLLGRSDAEPQGDEQVCFFSGIVDHAWSRPVPRMGILHGLRFLSRNSTAEQFLEKHQAALEAGQWVRCLLLRKPH